MNCVSVLSFNIWFSHYQMEARMAAIGDIVAKYLPDVIAFQEMTDVHFQLLVRHPVLRSYHWTPPSHARYYTMIGCKSMFRKARRIPFGRSGMGRDLLVVELSNGFTVATSHLESLANAPLRKEQLEFSLGMLGNLQNALFCGDTNMTEQEHVDLPVGWTDAWLASNHQEDGYTFDAVRNTMMAARNKWAASRRLRMRFDRAFVRLTSYRISHVSIVGDVPIAEGLFPSDHFGLLTRLSAT
eukprot:TRINITY_DN2326_c0_g1_i1.p1 TRINITY_DN2326_c0_g1~~TRINITY_DN2326_c0_g1_i1.p1  ORF type:complete len:241 (+),score=23.52 TRINITY_DN2326_c0_g1_i1:60-782(+)